MANELHREQMTDDQAACFDLLAKVFHGEHNVPPVRSFGKGIKCHVHSGQLATFDFDYLTRLVVLGHDQCIRVEVCQGGPGTVGVVLFKRHTREGRMTERHPTMEDAMAKIRAK